MLPVELRKRRKTKENKRAKSAEFHPPSPFGRFHTFIIFCQFFIDRKTTNTMKNSTKHVRDVMGERRYFAAAAAVQKRICEG